MDPKKLAKHLSPKLLSGGKSGFGHFRRLNLLEGVIFDVLTYMQEFLTIKTIDTVFSEF